MLDNAFYLIFGSNLKRLRQRKKVTQEQLAKAVCLSRSSIANIEAGRQKLLLHQLAELSTALSISMGSLLPKIKKEDDFIFLTKINEKIDEQLSNEDTKQWVKDQIKLTLEITNN